MEMKDFETVQQQRSCRRSYIRKLIFGELMVVSGVLSTTGLAFHLYYFEIIAHNQASSHPVVLPQYVTSGVGGWSYSLFAIFGILLYLSAWGFFLNRHPEVSQ